MRCKDLLSDVEPSNTLSGVRLERARRADAAQLRALDVTCFGENAWSPQSWRGVVADHAVTVLAARSGAELVGAMVLLPWAPVASLASLAVAPSWRHRGLGRGLLLEALQRSRAAGLRWLSLEVDADNSAAIRLYRREGFGVLRRFMEAERRRLEMLHRLGECHER